MIDRYRELLHILDNLYYNEYDLQFVVNIQEICFPKLTILAKLTSLDEIIIDSKYIEDIKFLDDMTNERTLGDVLYENYKDVDLNKLEAVLIEWM